jgi:chondroitin 4-sulfotransferase 11
MSFLIELKHIISLEKLKFRLWYNKGVSYQKKKIFKEHHNDLLFIHIPKTAGISLVKSLYDIDYSNHATIFDYLREDSSRAKHMTSFAVVRNPYSRLISAYNYLRDDGRSIIDKAWNDMYLKKYRSLDDFVNKGGLEKAINRNAEHFIPQNKFIYASGSLYVDEVFKLENMEKLHDFLKTHQIPEVKGLNRGKRNNIDKDSFLSMSAIAIVNELYHEDFSVFDYQKKKS